MSSQHAFAILLVLSGLALFILAIYHYVEGWWFLRRASQTTGTVVRRVIVGYWDEETITSTVVQYVVSGSTHEFLVSHLDENSLGRTIDIAYDPARPSDGRESPHHLLRTFMIVVLVGLVLLALAALAIDFPPDLAPDSDH
jgi:hypothetical protein